MARYRYIIASSNRQPVVADGPDRNTVLHQGKQAAGSDQGALQILDEIQKTWLFLDPKDPVRLWDDRQEDPNPAPRFGDRSWG